MFVVAACYQIWGQPFCAVNCAKFCRYVFYLYKDNSLRWLTNTETWCPCREWRMFMLRNEGKCVCVFHTLIFIFNRVVDWVDSFLQLIPGEQIIAHLLLHITQKLKVPDKRSTWSASANIWSWEELKNSFKVLMPTCQSMHEHSNLKDFALNLK